MSEHIKEQAHQLIDQLPEEKLTVVLEFLRRVAAEEEKPEVADPTDPMLMEDAYSDDEHMMAMDDFMTELGYSDDELKGLDEI